MLPVVNLDSKNLYRYEKFEDILIKKEDDIWHIFRSKFS